MPRYYRNSRLPDWLVCRVEVEYKQSVPRPFVFRHSEVQCVQEIPPTSSGSSGILSFIAMIAEATRDSARGVAHFRSVWLLPIFLLQPVRCAECFRRDYRLVFMPVKDRLPEPVAKMPQPRRRGPTVTLPSGPGRRYTASKQAIAQSPALERFPAGRTEAVFSSSGDRIRASQARAAVASLSIASGASASGASGSGTSRVRVAAWAKSGWPARLLKVFLQFCFLPIAASAAPRWSTFRGSRLPGMP